VFRGPLTLSQRGLHNDSHAAAFGVTDRALFAALPPLDYMGTLQVSGHPTPPHTPPPLSTHIGLSSTRLKDDVETAVALV
jgi:hypothetical protein